MNGPHFRNAVEADADALANLFRLTFTETFGHLYKEADLGAFLDGQSSSRWAEQLRDEAFAVRIAEERSDIIGFAKAGPVKLPVEDGASGLELRQLYVHKRVRGSGVAASLMDWVIQQARSSGAKDLYLSVYTENIRAQRFYARYGFVELGPCVFMVGNQADEDIIMRLSLA